MPTWQDRITNDSEPAVRVERDLRYRYAAPAIAGAQLWCDLGGGGPVPADFAGAIVLVNATDAPESARTLAADLNTPEGVAAVAAELQGEGIVVTCFGVIEHLDTFVPLIEMLEALKKATVMLSVPNDVLTGGATAWGKGAFAELRSLLPDDHVVATQTTLTGSEIGSGGERAPTHFVATWGGGALAEVSDVVALDLDEQRDWVRRREADLAYYRAAYETLRSEHEALAERVRELERRPRELPAGGS